MRLSATMRRPGKTLAWIASRQIVDRAATMAEIATGIPAGSELSKESYAASGSCDSAAELPDVSIGLFGSISVRGCGAPAHRTAAESANGLAGRPTDWPVSAELIGRLQAPRSFRARSRRSSRAILCFSVLSGMPEVARGRGHVPVGLLERAQDEVALERVARLLEPRLAGRRRRVELGEVVLERQVLVGDPFLVADRDEPLDQVLELADVARPPVRRQDLQRRIRRCPAPACGTCVL